jgi:hypothetical protein
MAKANQCKYVGSIEALQAAVTSIGAEGVWTACDAPRIHTFRGSAGDVVNWWPRTRTLQFQGRRSHDFVQGMVDALGASVHQTKQASEPQAQMPLTANWFA